MQRETFRIYLIRPSKYDEDGYPIRWLRTSIPANTLSCIHGIAQDCHDRQVLGPDVDLVIQTFDEGNTRIRPDQMIREINRDGGRALVCLVGVQSNQFPRAVDLARPFREAGIPVAMGGFHITGCIAMLPGMPPEMVAAQEMGISFFLGEAEGGCFDAFLRDAYAGEMKPVYDHVRDLPQLDGAPLPRIEKEVVERSTLGYGSIDLGRGCPFECTFCCIINVQGRGSRFRTADDLESFIRTSGEQGVSKFFITDDNFARNRNWEAFLDRLIHLRETEGMTFTMIIQVDTLCHKIPNFIGKCVRAGVDQVFIGLENINPDNLASSKKRQNKITDYRDMFLAWKQHPVVLTAGYIVGFPNDTRESILHDIEVLKRELPVDILSLSILTPLPGSEDHQKAAAAGVWMDPDLNKYDLTHAVTRHPNFKEGELDRVYREAWDSFYTPEHCRTVLRRAAALGSNKKISTANRLLVYGTGTKLYNVYSLDGGYVRLKDRKDRRPGLPLENPVLFYLKYWPESLWKVARVGLGYYLFRRMVKKLWADPARFDYRDLAITPTSEQDYAALDLFTKTRGGEEAVRKAQRIREITTTARVKAAPEAAVGEA
jgi:hypothetical protein